MYKNGIAIKYKKIALVTGGTGGLGSEICKQLAKKNYKVILSGRNIEKINYLVEEYKNKNLDVIPFVLDVSSHEDIENIYKFIVNNYERIDVLINNAAVYLDNRKDGIYPNILNLDKSLLEKTMAVNFFAPFQLSQKFLPLMQSKNYGRIVNVSSGMARFEDLDCHGSFYRISKTSLNALTCIFADISRKYNILVNSVCPGWVRSQMGGAEAVRSPYEGALGIVWAATLPKNGVTGGFFRDGRPLDWCQKMGDPY